MKISTPMIRTLARKISSKLSADTDKQSKKLFKKVQTSDDLKELNNLMYKQNELIETIKQTYETPELSIKVVFDRQINKFVGTIHDKQRIKTFHIEDEILLLTELEPTNLTSQEIIDSVVNKLKPQ